MPISVAIVHDDPEFTEATTAALETTGFHVVAFADPMVAIDQIENATTFGTLVTRVEFPPGKPNGVSLALVLRNTIPNLHVVFVARSEHERHTAGIGEFIPRPVDLTKLVVAVRSHQNADLYTALPATEGDAQMSIAVHQAAAGIRNVESGLSKAEGVEKMRYRLCLLGQLGDIRAAEAFLAKDDVSANEIALSVFSVCCDDFDGYEVWNGATMVSRGRGPQKLGHWLAVTQTSQREVLDLEDRMQCTFACVAKSHQLLDATAKLRTRIASESDPRLLSRHGR